MSLGTACVPSILCPVGVLDKCDAMRLRLESAFIPFSDRRHWIFLKAEVLGFAKVAWLLAVPAGKD